MQLPQIVQQHKIAFGGAGVAATALLAWLAFGYFGIQAAFIDDVVDDIDDDVNLHENERDDDGGESLGKSDDGDDDSLKMTTTTTRRNDETFDEENTGRDDGDETQ